MILLNPICELFVENYLNYFFGKKFFELEKKLKKENFPIVSRIVGYFLSQIVLVKKPKYILELGTGVGLSTIYMAFVIKKFKLPTKIVTLDIRQDFYNKAKEIFKLFNVEDVIDHKLIDSTSFLKETFTSFDLIFFDHEKSKYKKDLEIILNRNLVNPFGIIIIDNLFGRGEIFLPNSKRKRKQVLSSFIDYLFSSQVLKRAFVNILPISDGLGFLTFF